jgi:hypothetical protein
VTLIVSGLTFQHGNSYFGSAISTTGPTTVTDCTFSGSVARYLGGAIDSGGPLTVTRSTFTGNAATSTDNLSQNEGGAIYHFAGRLTVTDSTFSGNTPGGSGGGIGGGIYNNSGTVTVMNSTFTGNAAGRTGGGIYNGGTLTVTNSTISGNSASSGGGFTTHSVGSVTLTNTIVAGSTGGDIFNLGGAFAASHSLIGDSASGTGLTDGVNGNIIGHPALLGTLGPYGGMTRTVPLLPGSPAIDSADDVACAATGAGNVSSVDQRGTTRPQGAHCDIGAFESQGFTLARMSGDNQSTGITYASANLLIITVASAHGEPIDGGTVTFTAPITGASLQPASTSVTIGTPTSGQARLSATANSVVGGPCTVTATAGKWDDTAVGRVRTGTSDRSRERDGGGERDDACGKRALHVRPDSHRHQPGVGQHRRRHEHHADGDRLRHGSEHAGAPRRRGTSRCQHHERNGDADRLRRTGTSDGTRERDGGSERDGAGGEYDIHVRDGDRNAGIEAERRGRGSTQSSAGSAANGWGWRESRFPPFTTTVMGCRTMLDAEGVPCADDDRN